MSRLLVVSSDGHAGIPVERYGEYADPGDREAFADAVALHNQRVGDYLTEFSEAANDTQHMDPAGRCADLERDGVVAEVLYPTPTAATMVPTSDFLANGAWRPHTREDRRLQWASEKAYNRWLAEFCTTMPGRFIGLMYLPWHDLDACVAEVKWGAANGLGGVLLPAFNYDAPEYTQPAWDPLWAACTEAGFSLNCHGGYGVPEWGPHLSGPASAPFSQEHSFFMGRVLSHLIFGGVFDRFPTLQLAFTEALAFWLPAAIDTMERAFNNMNERAKYEVEFVVAGLPERRPWEYWSTHGHVGCSVLAMADLELWPRLGADTMMYGVDYPHPEGSWGDAKAWMRATFGRMGIAEREARLLLGENAVRLHHLDIDQLRPLAEKYGPTVEEALTPATPEDVDQLVEAVAAKGRGAAVRTFQNAVVKSQAIATA